MDCLIQQKLSDRLAPTYIDLQDESEHHRHHKEGGSGHYALTIVSAQFVGMSIIQQHRAIYDALSAEMGTIIHALTIRSFTPQQWQQR